MLTCSSAGWEGVMGEHHYTYPTVTEIRPDAPRVLPGRLTGGDRYFRGPADSEPEPLDPSPHSRQFAQDVW